jgi:hypothetical protein
LPQTERSPGMRLVKPAIVPAAILAAWILGMSMSPAGSQPPGTSPQPTTVHKEVVSKQATERTVFLDLGKEGDGPGDRVLNRGPLFDAADSSQQVGQFVVDVILLSRGSFQASAFTAEFPEGSLTASGKASFEEFETGAPFAVTGGTGAYEGARGRVTVQELSRRVIKFTFDAVTQ